MKLILNLSKESPRDRRILVVVHRALRVDVGDLLVEPALARTNVFDAFEHFVEVVLAKKIIGILQTLVVHRESLDDVFAEDVGRPDAEGRGLLGIHAVADRDHQIEVVKGDLAVDDAVAFPANLFHFGTSCRFDKLATLIDVLDVLRNSLRVDVKACASCERTGTTRRCRILFFSEFVSEALEEVCRNT